MNFQNVRTKSPQNIKTHKLIRMPVRRHPQHKTDMNATRRKQLEKIADKLDELNAELESLRDDEQNAFDNMPESLQDSERGERMTTIIDYLDDATSSLSDTIDYIESAINE